MADNTKTLPAPVEISNDLFNELKELWPNKDLSFNKRLEQLTGNIFSGSMILLYGDGHGEPIRESLVGRLEAFAPGVVVLNPWEDGWKECAGILKVGSSGQRGQYMEVKCFNQYASLCFYRNPFPEKQPRFPGCPVWVSMGFGRDEGMSIGIDADRWKFMCKWFAEWLPDFDLAYWS